MNQKDCCELPVCTKTQKLSKDHLDHQYDFNKVKQAKLREKNLSWSSSLPAESSEIIAHCSKRCLSSWNYCKLTLLKIWETLQGEKKHGTPQNNNTQYRKLGGRNSYNHILTTFSSLIQQITSIFKWELLTYNKWKIGPSPLRNWCEWKTQITGNNKIHFYW